MLQAEDGIRDVAVTGVQTCALPISIEIYRDLWGDYDEDGDSFQAEELWDLVHESLRKDPDIISEIGQEF